MVIACLALIVALGGSAFAVTSFVGKDGRIHACVGKHGGLTVPKPGKRCGKGKTPLAWDQRGLPASEPWRVVGDPGQPQFGTCSSHSWQSQAAGVQDTVAFYRDPLGIVHLRGVATGPTDPADCPTIFKLPPGYRTAKAEDTPTVTVLADGEVQSYSYQAQEAGGTTLNSVTFRCEPSGQFGCP